MKRKRSIDDLHKTASDRGGKCLSTVYLGMRTKYKWECSSGHNWSATADSVLNQPSWCPKCVGKFISKEQRISELEAIAISRGGKLIGGDFINCESKMIFECFRGHIFNACLDKLKHGKTWCPRCKIFRGETFCRIIFEQLFKVPFEKSRPYWLINSRGTRLELDGFNEDLKIAFEYQGIQHLFEHKKFFHKQKSYLRQITNDLIKKNLCKKERDLFVCYQ